MRSFSKIVFLCILLFSVLSSFAGNKEAATAFDSANAAYAKGNYERAVKLYESIVAKGLGSHELYFNLGNAYYKTDDIGRAILNYERAKRSNPSDEDLAANMKLAVQRTEDRIDEAPQLFLSEWKNGIADLLSEKGWSVVCIVLFAVTLLLAAVYILSGRQGLRKAGFFGAAVLFIMTVTVFFIAQYKYKLTRNSAEAVIISSSVTVTGSPDEKGTKLFILHEGTKVSVLQENAGWTEVRIANGNVGWVKPNSLEKI